MRLATTLLFAMLTCSASAESSLPVGTWSADARLFSKEARLKTGPVSAVISIALDGTISGTLGGMAFEAQPAKHHTKTHAVYVATLTSSNAVQTFEDRRVLVLMVSRQSSSAPDIEFHVKRRDGFDPGMLVGHIDLRETR